MNIVLNIGGQDVEVDKSFDFAITKTYEELQNPTIINNEWSKTLSIPMTAANNQLFGDIFNVERALIGNASATNTGIYFNPTKKANFTLYYNSGILMTGYAKLSAVDNVKHTYEINLFGEIGNTFLELLKCTFFNNSEDNELQKYIISNYLSENLVLNKELVKASWDNDEPRLSLDDDDLDDTDILGFTPTSCGLPKNFDSKTVLNNDGSFDSLAGAINDLKGIDYGDTIIGDGLTERQYGEFRVWLEKPYIYVNKLWQMMVKKSQEICEFPLRLDKTWFNKTNPYYSSLVYMCTDFELDDNRKLETTDVAQDSTVELKYNAEVVNSYKWINVVPMQYVTIKTNIPVPIISDDTVFEIAYWNCLNIKFTQGDNSYDYVIISKNNNAYKAGHDDEHCIVGEPAVIGGCWAIKATLPFYLSTDDTVVVGMKWLSSDSDVSPSTYAYYLGGNSYKIIKQNPQISYVTIYGGRVLNSYIDYISLNKIWNPDVAPFSVLLNYAKMFGLIFQVNQEDRCIDVTCRNVYFQDYTIEDWTDKINTLNTYKIEQPTFEKKYINFNYDEVDATNYKNYLDKYQIAIGGKRLITDYDFNNDEENLFEGIQPTNVVNETLSTIKNILQWIPGQAIVREKNTEVYFDNKKDNDSANIYSAFAFRRKNQNVSNVGQNNFVKITEDSPTEVNADTYCFHGGNDSLTGYSLTSSTIPFISTIDESGKFGCTFNMPAEITFNPAVMPYDDAVFIYDNFWRDYINERYNTSNKKVTLQVNLSPLDFANFEFRKFVKINNTLYIVNKIVDYGIGNGENTTVELISISDISGYTAGKTFHYAYFDRDNLEVEFTGGTASTQATFKVEADIAWHLSTSYRGAVTFDVSSGTGDSEINVYVSPLRAGQQMRQIPISILNSSNEVLDVMIINQYRSN